MAATRGHCPCTEGRFPGCLLVLPWSGWLGETAGEPTEHLACCSPWWRLPRPRTVPGGLCFARVLHGHQCPWVSEESCFLPYSGCCVVLRTLGSAPRQRGFTAPTGVKSQWALGGCPCPSSVRKQPGAVWLGEGCAREATSQRTCSGTVPITGTLRVPVPRLSGQPAEDFGQVTRNWPELFLWFLFH